MLKVKSKVTCDTKELTKLINKLKALDGAEVETGYFEEDEHPEHNVAMSDLAAWQEYGTKVNGREHIPSRPFMYQAWVFSEPKQMKLTEKLNISYLYNSSARPNSINNYLEPFGNLMESNIKSSIYSGNFQENATLTIELKGHSNVLIETGYLADNSKTKYKTGNNKGGK